MSLSFSNILAMGAITVGTIAGYSISRSVNNGLEELKVEGDSNAMLDSAQNTTTFAVIVGCVALTLAVVKKAL